MSWQTHNPTTGGRASSGLAFGIYDYGDRGVHAMIRFASDLTAQLDWRRGDRVRIDVGTGEHAGLVRLTKAAFGYKISRQSGAGEVLIVKCRAWPALKAEPVPSVTCRHTVHDGTLEFCVPAGALGTPKRA
ncbi:MAG: hypothetical protein JO021_22000 [Alphaproteobacteria bacterium]|nr:hypothetical protein [Alphaproteobacteria bacterium]